MTRALRIAVAEDDEATEYWFQKCLPLLGHEVLFTARSGEELIARCRLTPPDLVIADIKLPGLDGIAACEQVCRERPVPIVLVSGYYEDELVRRAEEGHVLAYLLKPIERDDLKPALALAVRRFEQMHTLSQEAADLRKSLEDRKLVERAKGIIMKRSGVDEPEAFQRLQKASSNRNVKMAEVALSIVEAERAFAGDGPEHGGQKPAASPAPVFYRPGVAPKPPTPAQRPGPVTPSA